MADSGTLQIARVSVMPRLLACLRAARVSAVSPDWGDDDYQGVGFGQLTRVGGPEAISTVQGISATDSSQ